MNSSIGTPIQVSKVEKSFGSGEGRVHVLRNVSFDVPTGQIVSIVGHSGSGKSTLLAMMAGLDRPDSGEISIAGTHLSSMDESALTLFRSRNIGIVFQSYYLVPYLNALENVMLPLEILQEQNARLRATKLLTKVGLTHRLTHLPSQLSGGECQRVAMARALVHSPRLVLADEPSGNLDSGTGDGVMDFFFRLVRDLGTTAVLVTHNDSLARRCDRAFRMEHGQLMETQL
jgi:putative ABC transport system ATP-binding protein